MTDTNLHGKIGEAKALAYFISMGYEVFTAFCGKASIDMIIYKDKKIETVEIKSTEQISRTDPAKYVVELKRVRSNKTENNITNFKPEDVDLLCVYIVPQDRLVIINTKEIKNQSSIQIG